MSILINGMEMPKHCAACPIERLDDQGDEIVFYCLLSDGDTKQVRAKCRREDCPLIHVPPHGDLIDRDALIADLKRQCKEVFRVNTVSPDDFWITRNEAYNERLWGTWCESFYGYLQTRQTVIPAEEES